MLHTVNKSPFTHQALQTCLRFALAEEPILLYEDGVFAVMDGTKLQSMINNALKNHPVYVVQADLKARGIINVISGVKKIDYGGFVDLVAEHKVNNWL